MASQMSFGLKSLCVGFLLVIMIPCFATAQSSGTGALTGTVTDSSGAVIPNVTVTVSSLDTGQVRTTFTGGNGSYQMPLLLPGNYSVKFEAAGFESATFPSVTVTVTETGTLNSQLQVGAQSQEVTVQASVETVQTASSTLGTVVSSQAVVDLPLNTRNFTNLIALSSGANATVNNATLLGKGYQAIAVNGASIAQNNFQMDGVSVVNYMGNGTQQEEGNYGGLEIPPPDSIQEFKIQTSTYDASYGKNVGANVNVVTKSGTNDFHGTAFEFFRNTLLNANDFFIKRTELSDGLPNKEGVLNQNQFGGVFGGPVKKDKLFFFISYQRTWQKNGLADSAGAAYNLNLPPIPGAYLAPGTRGNCLLTATTVAGCDATSQAFAAALGANVCPSKAANQTSFNLANSSAGATLTNQIGAQVACNGSNINPVALRILQLTLPTGDPRAGQYYLTGSGLTPAGAANNFGYVPTTLTYPAYYFEHQGMGNVDYVINSKNTLSGKFYYGIDPSTSNFVAAIITGPFLQGGQVGTWYSPTSGVLKLTTIVTNNLVNEARFTYQRNAVNEYNDNNFTAAQVGMTPINPGPNPPAGAIPTAATLPQLPIMTISNVYEFGTHNFSVLNERENQFFVSDQISWTHGKHTIRTGFEWEHELYYWNYPGFGIGTLTIPSFGDFLIGVAGCTPAVISATCNGTGFSNVNTVGSGSDRFKQSQLIAYYYAWTASSFVQDDFKVNSKLTLNLGLRWEFDPIMGERNGGTTAIFSSLVQTQPIPGTGCVYNGLSWGAGAAGTGCSFAGYVVPASYKASVWGPLATGVFQNTISNEVPHNPTPWDNFAPRIGFAWQPLSTNKFVVRGGFGYFYTRLSGGQLTSGFHQSPPVVAAVNQSGAANAAASLALPFAQTPPGFVPRWANLATGASQNLNFGGSGTFVPNFTTPLTYQYNLNVQYEFAPTWVLELGYVGSHGIHQYLARDENGALLADNSNPLYGLTTNTTSGGSSTNAAAAAIRAPELGLANAFGFQTTDGSYLFDSLQATVRKQFSHGLQFQGAYTWSRAFVATQVGNLNASFTDNVPVMLEYGLNPLYHPQRLVLNYTWTLPFGKHAGLTDKLVSGWTVSGVTTIQDGVPMTLTNTALGSTFGSPVTSNAEYAAGMGAANIATGGSVEARINGYFNKGAFASSVPATNLAGCTAASGNVSANCSGNLWGNVGLDNILGPGQNNWDMSLAKITRVGGLREDATLQFRAEFFNTFNHTQFMNPSSVATNNAAFGQIGQASVNPRLIQLALKYAF